MTHWQTLQVQSTVRILKRKNKQSLKKMREMMMKMDLKMAYEQKKGRGE